MPFDIYDYSEMISELSKSHETKMTKIKNDYEEKLSSLRYEIAKLRRFNAANEYLSLPENAMLFIITGALYAVTVPNGDTQRPKVVGLLKVLSGADVFRDIFIEEVGPHGAPLNIIQSRLRESDLENMGVYHSMKGMELVHLRPSFTIIMLNEKQDEFLNGYRG